MPLTTTAIALLCLTGMFQMTGSTAPSFPKLTVIVTDCYQGHPIEGAVVKIVPDVDGPAIRYLRTPKENSVSVPPGSYSVVAEGTGWWAIGKPITVGNKDLLTTVCLNVAPIELPSSRPAGVTLVGAVNKRHLIQGPHWVRLTGLYHDHTSTELVTDLYGVAGSFRFVGLRPGRYQLILFCGGDLKASQFVDVRGEQDTRVQID
jgi:hypothetical protein